MNHQQLITTPTNGLIRRNFVYIDWPNITELH